MEEVRQSNVHQLYLTEEIALLRAAARCTCLKTCPSTDTDPLSYLPPVPGNRISKAIMEKNKVSVEVLRAVDHDIAHGVWPDMTDHGWEKDDWPDISKKVMAADILVLTSSIWLGEKTSVCSKGDRAALREQSSTERGRPVRLLQARRRLPHYRERGWREALRDEHSLFIATPRLCHSATGGCRLAWRGWAWTKLS